MEILIILIILLTFSAIVFVKCMADLSKRIAELEKRIDTLQYQTDDVLHDINIVNKNVRSTYGMLGAMKDENK